MNESLLNKAACRRFVLRWAKRRTGCNFERVAASYLEEAEAKLRFLFQQSVDRHRSVGKTVKDFI